MDTASDITVVIPVYNREKEIERCLDSVALQTVRPAEVIVVDDGSTDRTAEIARSHPAGVTVIGGDHKGAAAARNKGLERVRTPWTLFFDSDDIMEPDHIATAAAAISPDVDLVGWEAVCVGRDGGRTRFAFNTRDIGWHNIMHGYLGTVRYMARTDFFRRAGGWNESLGLWDDIELGARLLALGPRIVKTPGVNVTVISSEVSITGVRWMENHRHHFHTLDALARSVGSRHADWVALKQAILAGDLFREDKDAGREMFRAIAKKTPAVRFAYHYRRFGGRGAARFLRPFFSR